MADNTRPNKVVLNDGSHILARSVYWYGQYLELRDAVVGTKQIAEPYTAKQGGTLFRYITKLVTSKLVLVPIGSVVYVSSNEEVEP